jgi:hypothetical protein
MADGPPFYRLKMSKGTGQGVRAGTVTPVDLINQGFDEGVAAGSAGGLSGSWARVGEDDPVVLGTTGVGTTVALSLIPTDFTGDLYVTRAVFSGAGLSAYRIISTTKNGVVYTLSTPFECDGGDEFTMSVDRPLAGGPTWSILIETQFTDGVTEDEMTVELYDVTGVLNNTVVITATVENTFISKLKAPSGLIGIFVPPATGTVADAAPMLADISGNTEPAIKLRRISGFDDFVIQDTDVPGALLGLDKAVDLDTFDLTTVYGAMDGPMSSEAVAWVIFLKYRTEISSSFTHDVGFSGDQTSGFPPRQNNTSMRMCVSGASLHVQTLNWFSSTWSTRLDMPGFPTPAEWLMLTLTLNESTGVQINGSSVDNGSWPEVAEVLSAGSEWKPSTWPNRDGITMGLDGALSGSRNPFSVACIVPYSAVPSDVQLAAIFDSIA